MYFTAMYVGGHRALLLLLLNKINKYVKREVKHRLFSLIARVLYEFALFLSFPSVRPSHFAQPVVKLSTCHWW